MHNPAELIHGIPVLAGYRAERQLSCGPVSEKWLISCGTDTRVLRADRPLARTLGMDRTTELTTLTALAQAGWVEQPLWADPERGVLVVSWVTGRPWTASDYQDPLQLERLAVLLRRLHNVPANVPRFRLAERVQMYARLCATTAAMQTADIIAKDLRTLEDATGTTAVCHNDPVGGNVVDDGQLHLIDLEFAAAGDPLFDLAAVLEQHAVARIATQRFIGAYRDAGGSFDQEVLDLWRQVYRRTAGLWNQVLAGRA